MENFFKYLRISITDKCNLKCKYCDTGKYCKLPPASILSFENICRIVRCAAECGAEKIRITGGEPLMRNNFLELFKMIKSISGINELTFTTNGILLDRWADKLFDIGIRRFNVSLDTLCRENFKKINGSDNLDRVLKNLEDCKKIGFAPIKINTVLLKGINDSEIPELIKYAANNGFLIRFIELMDISHSKGFFEKHFISSDCVIKKLKESYVIEKITNHDGALEGPAVYYKIKGEGIDGRIGFITPVSHHFCKHCNRLRLTVDGKLKPCLLRADEINLNELLNNNISDNELKEIFKNTFKDKNKASGKHLFNNNFRNMSEIGG
ncbi:MAG: GTP 3',8-cyclase MoaA [Candidatus Wallbacteria bacterium]